MDSISDLWGDVKATAVTPAHVPRIQANHLKRKTGGLLEATVQSYDEDGRKLVRFEVVAPVLGRVGEALFAISHDPGKPYPAILHIDFFVQEAGLFRASNDDFDSEYQIDVRSQSDLMDVLPKVFQSPQVQTTLESLIASSNEVAAEGREPAAVGA